MTNEIYDHAAEVGFTALQEGLPFPLFFAAFTFLHPDDVRFTTITSPLTPFVSDEEGDVGEDGFEDHLEGCLTELRGMVEIRAGLPCHGIALAVQSYGGIFSHGVCMPGHEEEVERAKLQLVETIANSPDLGGSEEKVSTPSDEAALAAARNKRARRAGRAGARR